jgi:hypothetical protein
MVPSIGSVPSCFTSSSKQTFFFNLINRAPYNWGTLHFLERGNQIFIYTRFLWLRLHSASYWEEWCSGNALDFTMQFRMSAEHPNGSCTLSETDNYRTGHRISPFARGLLFSNNMFPSVSHKGAQYSERKKLYDRRKSDWWCLGWQSHENSIFAEVV